MNDINLKAILTPLALMLAGLAATHLNFLGIDQATWNTIIFGVLTGIGSAILGFFTRTRNVVDTAGSLPGTVVVTTPELANSLPANADVVSNTVVKVVSK